MIQLVQQLESYAHLEPLLQIDITSIIEKYTKLVEERDINYDFDVIYIGAHHILEVKFLEQAKKKITSPRATKFYDLLIDGESILPGYSYHEYIELVTDGMRLGRMKTYCYSILKMMEVKDE